MAPQHINDTRADRCSKKLIYPQIRCKPVPSNAEAPGIRSRESGGNVWLCGYDADSEIIDPRRGPRYGND
jgi:hypothetical protein